MTNYSTTHVVFFSPTGTSARVARAIAEGIGMGRRIETDLTLDEAVEPVELKDSLTIIAVPVYGGRVAPTALQRIKRLKGTNCPAILVAVYGNRDYEDALVELRDETMRLGFTPMTAGAFIGEHSFSTAQYPTAAGRPDDKDLNIARQFGADSLAKLEKTAGELTPFFIKGNVPYKELKPGQPVSPISTDDCCGCGVCIDVCPTHAIQMNEAGDGVETDANLCIKCCACVKACPSEARVFDNPFAAFLFNNFSARREPELFF